MTDQVVLIDYSNHRGERRARRIQPKSLWFGSTEWHPEPQWLLDATDLEKNVDRSFAMKDIHSWRNE